MDLRELIPESFEGWTLSKSMPIPSSNELFEYIDGGAELYISYGFGEAFSGVYTREGQPDITADIYDLLESRNAFGVFTQTRETENETAGQGGYAIPGALFFWKDRFYVSLSSWDSTPESESCLRSLAGYIDDKITSAGPVPDVVQMLPEKELVPSGYIYFHHYVWLNALSFISNDNILNIDETTDAIIARYSTGADRKHLLMVKYSDDQKASEAYRVFGNALFPEGLTDKCRQLSDNTWLAADISGNIITAVFRSSSKQAAREQLENALESISKTQHK